MTYTENHHLPTWEKSDRIMMDTFNAMTAALDAAIPRIVTGTYTGTGAATRTVALPARPRAVLVLPQDGISNNQSGGLVLDGETCIYGTQYPVLEISDEGFVVHYNYLGSSSSIGTNTADRKYFYIALL